MTTEHATEHPVEVLKIRLEMAGMIGDSPDLIERISALAEQPTQDGDRAANLLVRWNFWERHAAHIMAFQTDGYVALEREQRYARASTEVWAAA